MRVIHILESWNNAGTERYVTNLTNTRCNSKTNHEYIILGDINDQHTISKLPGEVTHLGANRFKYLKLFMLLISNKSTTCLYHLHLYTSLFPISLILYLLKCKTLLTYHVPLSQWNMRHKLFWVLSGYMASIRVVVSSPIKLEFKKYFKTIVIPPPVYNKNRDGDIISSNYAKHEINIVCVGRLENNQKDWPTLIRAISKLPLDSLQKIHVYIVGGGPDEIEIKDLILSENLDNIITLTGHLEAKDVSYYYEKASISILPSKFEGFGMSAVEAMTYGILTITSNFPASFDFIKHGLTGYHFNIGDSSHLASILDLVINDCSLRDKIAAQGKNYSRKEFSDKRCAIKYSRLYNLQSSIYEKTI